MASNTTTGSSSYRSNRSTRSKSGGQMVCYHQQIAPIRVVRVEGPTKGKRFYGCAYWPATCGFFKWADELDDVGELQHGIFVRDGFIQELEDQNILLREKIKKLKMKQEKLVDEVEEMGIATTETLYELKSNTTEKKLLFGLFMSWVFFAIMFLLK
ncbi:hypothetical protein BVRB_9g214870 [Beta vulgaris subsp. vulgaris]|nr:hypothetical protein BVRB_9g214870 [Beta vulgaris subsp. vulgaris]